MIFQYLYLVVMAAVLLWVRPKLLVWAIAIGNFFATMALRDDPLSVGVVDATSGAMMLMAGLDMWPVAAIYAVMVLIDLSAWGWSFNLNATYAIIEVLAYLQLFIIGGGIGGTRRLLRSASVIGDRCGTDPDFCMDSEAARQKRQILSGVVISERG